MFNRNIYDFPEGKLIDRNAFIIESRDFGYISRKLYTILVHIKTFGTSVRVKFYPSNRDILPGFIKEFCEETGFHCNGKIQWDMDEGAYYMKIERPLSEMQSQNKKRAVIFLLGGVATAVATFVGLNPRNTGMDDFSAITYAEGIEQARIGVRDGVVQCLTGNAGEIKLGNKVYGWPRNDNRAIEIGGNSDNTITLRDENDFLAEKILSLPAQVSNDPNLLCEKND